MKASKTICGLIAALALGLGVVACGSDDEESSGGGGGGGGGGASGNEIQKVSGAADKGTITVGSKNFPEQYILGNIYADALTAAGFKVKKSLDIGSEVLAYKSLQQGEIDGYPEYTGTVLTAFFEVPVTKVPKDPTQAFDQTKSELAKNEITALPHTPFENTYRLAITKETHEKLGSPKTTSASPSASSASTACSGSARRTDSSSASSLPASSSTTCSTTARPTCCSASPPTVS